MMQTMGNSMPVDITKMILSDIATLRKMPDLAHKISAYQPEPDPVQQQLQQLELQKLQLQLQELQANAMLKVSQANLADAKAGESQATTDQKTLDFVEQESGVKQERDLQKQGEQARAQTQMKIVGHQLDMEKERMKGLQQYLIEQEKAKQKVKAS